MSAPAKKIIAAYVPVIHSGYLRFLSANADASELYVFDETVLGLVDYIRKDLRALKPAEAVQALAGVVDIEKITELSLEHLGQIDKAGLTIVMPDEDVSREVGKKLKKAKVVFAPVFLRWDRQNVDQPDEQAEVSRSKSDERLMREAINASKKSSDIWRRVGAVLVDGDGHKMDTAHNVGEPTEHSPWAEGDPRNVFNRGVGIEMSLFTHAEARLIANAANKGISTKGASMYVTVFPCPACAKLIAHSGIAKLLYKDGYAVLDGKRILNDYGVILRKVIIDGDTFDDPAIPYKKV
jgi:dCMP deaminase